MATRTGGLQLDIHFKPHELHGVHQLSSLGIQKREPGTWGFQKDDTNESFSEKPDEESLQSNIFNASDTSSEETDHGNVTDEGCMQDFRYEFSRQVAANYAQKGHYFGYSSEECTVALEKAYARKVVKLNHALRNAVLSSPGGRPAGEGIPAYSGTFIYSLLLSSVAYLGQEGIGDIVTASVTALNLRNSPSERKTYSRDMLTAMKTVLQSSPKQQSAFVRTYAKVIATAKPEKVDALLHSITGQVVRRISSRAIIAGIGEMTTANIKKKFGSLFTQLSDSLDPAKIKAATTAKITPLLQKREQLLGDMAAAEEDDTLGDYDELRAEFDVNNENIAMLARANGDTARVNARRKYAQVKRLLRTGKGKGLLDEKGWKYRLAATAGARNKVPTTGLMGYRESGTLPLFSVSTGWSKDAKQWGILWHCNILAQPNYSRKIEQGYQNWSGGYKPIEMMANYVKSNEFLEDFRHFLYPRGS